MSKLTDILNQHRRYVALLEKAVHETPEKIINEIKDSDGLVFAKLIVDPKEGVVILRKGGLELRFLPGDIVFIHDALARLLED
jgi:hypothetical protein